MATWAQVLERLAVLRGLDKQRQAFGAGNHGYTLAPVVPENDLAEIEHRLGREFPPQLRSFYLEVGNGGAGPYYGMYPAEGLTAERADSLRVAEEGCGHEIHVVTSGARRDRMRSVSVDGEVYEGDCDLIGYYLRWLDDEIDAFDAVAKSIAAGKTMAELSDALVASHDRYDGRELAISLLDVAKPAALFGDANQRIYHGAVQFPWYEQQLRRYRGEPEPHQRPTMTAPSSHDQRPFRPWWKFW